MKRTLCVAATGILLLVPACTGNIVENVTGGGKVSSKGIDIRIPSQLLGLRVQSENIAKQLKATKRPYIDNVGLFSLREADLVRATFQISRFNALARPESPTFRNNVISLLGGARAQPVRVNSTTVYVTTGNDQSIFVWFEGRGFFVLTCHRAYEFPRTLLRHVLDLKVSI